MINLYKSSEDTICELAFDEIDKGCWVELINPSSDELALITEKTGVYLDFLTAALDDEERSRIEVEQDQLLILIDIPLLRSNKDYDTLPLGIIITTDYIITVCLEVNAVLADFSTHNARSFCTFKKTRFLFQILYKSALLYL